MSGIALPRVKPHARVLVVEDEPDSAALFSTLMESEGHAAVQAMSGEAALEHLREDGDFDLVLLDLVLPGLSGWEVLEYIKQDGKLRYVPVVVLSALGDKSTILKALEMGAEDFLTKPVDVERMISRVRVMLRIRSLYEDLIHERSGRQQAQRSLEMRRYLSQVMGGSSQVQSLADVLENVVDTDTTVLLEGESGTGKGLLAETVHRFSSRQKGPMVVVNCSAYPETLLSSELFGHEKGAFTGAIRRKAGRFELADNGTIFLDEIAEISPLTQLALLRVIQDRQFERVGGEKTLTVDVRVVAATNKPLAEMVAQGRFREDLFYRLNVVRLEVPSLRQRPEDIPFLAHIFLSAQAERLGKAIFGFEREALARLMGYAWPGNVRELRNVVEHAALMCREDVVCMANLPPRLAGEASQGQAVAQPVGRLWDQEREMIASTLERVNWNKYRAAQVLGIARSTLYGKIKKYGLVEPEADSGQAAPEAEMQA
ncbi:MAG: sigma-54 dependent transcriptional regulator [Desulfarculaceae bacterium]|nr:sigma-54 dependent transcriptional regulator [Desulfarculaceae bacterium]MCF8072203.1 sigma-54 dependent transcriptional regulator [Desulfarculaceae bacterium]MCF8100124.1 sigma-54 dependent transcriptional regulator [Desulfarculaceae bacterium]